MSNNLIVGYTTNDESRGDIGHALPLRRHPRRRRHRLHLVRLRAVHAEQRTALQHVPDRRTTSRSFGVKHSLTFGVSAEKYQLRERVLPGQAERLRLQHAGRLLRRRERLPRQPEPHDVGRSTLRRFQVRYNNIPGQEKPIQPLDGVVRRRLRAGRVAAEVEPDDHGRLARRRRRASATPATTTRTSMR